MMDRKDAIGKNAQIACNIERDYMQSKHEQALGSAALGTGTVAVLLVTEALPRLHEVTPPDSRRMFVVMENRFEGGRYQVRGKGFLLKERVHRKHLIPVQNEHVRDELKYTALHTTNPMPLEEHIHSEHSNLHSMRPVCKCRNGCKTPSCACRLRGCRCGTDCHPHWCSKHHASCANYK